ncbi:MAG: pitrilysin family protein [Candidatus Melainabacteria bacterium]|nr:pitrilysin family protein [Candidatus Melainabacteria bacterium]
MKNANILTGLGLDFVARIGAVVEYRLRSNGLKVLFVENHAAPVVTSMIVYRVGSRNEGVGYTGSTHFLEHMMFKGTTDRSPAKGTGVDDILKPIGALYNATTSYDRTNYYEVVGREHLETVLGIEADRMRNLVLTKPDRDAEMTVVRNEFERGENEPSSVMYKELMAMAFREHPYHHSVIGWRSDVEGVPMERMQAFYDTFYWPNNATLIVAGDFDEVNAATLVVKLFGAIPTSPNPIPEVYTTEPAQEGERTFTIRRVGNDLPQVWIGFHVPESTHADTYPLAVAAALLGSSSKRASRLYKGLVETGLAVSCWAQAGQNRNPGLFMMGATCNAGVDPKTVEAAMLAELNGLVKSPAVARELNRVKAANRKATILQHDDSVKFAELLCDGESVADWQWSMGYDDNFDAVTAGDITRVATQYFGATNRTSGHFIPEAEATSVEADQTVASESAAVSVSTPTFAQRVSRQVLPNGLTVLAMAVPNSGTVSLAGSMRAGSYFGSYDKALLPELTAYLLTKGSSEASKAELAEQLDAMGTGLGFSTGAFNVGFKATLVKDDAPAYLALLGNVLRAPLFDASELAKSLKEFEAFIRNGSSDTGRLAGTAFAQALYGKDVVYHEKDTAALLAELSGYSREDLVAYHGANYSPKGLILTIVGDIDPANVLSLLPASLTEWQGADVKAINIDPIAAPAAAMRVDVPVAGKASADVIIGLPVHLKRTDPDYAAANLANAALGGDTMSSRLGLVVREKNGLTYGITCGFENVTAGSAPWKISVSVNPDNVGKALALVREVVDDYRATGITEKELADEKGRAYGAFVVSLRSSLGIASALTQFEFNGLGVAGLDGIKAQYDAVTKEEVDAAIRKYFNLDHAVTVVSGTIAAK